MFKIINSSIILKNLFQRLKEVSSSGLVYLFVANLSVGLAGFISQFFVAGILGPEGNGEVKIFQNTIVLLSIVSLLGLNSGILRIGSLPGHENQKLFFVNRSILFIVISTSIVLIIYFYSNNLLEEGIIGVFNNNYLLLSVIVVFLNINYIFIAYYQAIRRLRLLAIVQVFSKLIGIIAVVVLTNRYSKQGFYFGFAILSIVAPLVLFILYIYEYFVSRISEEKPEKELKITFFKYSGINLLSNVATQIGLYIDVLIMKYFEIDLKLIGLYGFSTIAVLAFQLIINTIQQFLIPLAIKNFQAKKDFKTDIKKTLFFASILIGFCLILFFAFLTNLVYKKYIQSMVYTIILIIAWVFKMNCITYSVSNFAKDRVFVNLIVSLISMIITLVLQILLLFRLGLLGVSIAQIISNGFMLVLYKITSRVGKKRS